MKIAAGCTYFNSGDILPLAIENLLTLGVTDFYLIDHASTDETSNLIISKVGHKANLRILNKQSAAFLQGRMMTLLAFLAKEDGFDYFIPFDSDEFLDFKNPTNFDLLQELQSEFKNGNLFVRIPELDYVQASSVKDFSEENINTVKFSAKVSNSDQINLKELIKQGGSGLAREKSSKIILNLNSEIINSQFLIAEGAHTVTNFDQNNFSEAKNLLVRHLPFRSEKSVVLRTVDAKRRDFAGFDKEVGFQSRQLVEKDQSRLSKYWLKNSWTENNGVANLSIQSNFVELIPDTKFIEVFERIQRYRQSSAERVDLSSEFLESNQNQLLKRAFSISMDYSEGFPEFSDLRQQNAHLKNLVTNLNLEVQGVRRDHDVLANRLNSVLQSRSWKLIQFFRKISRLR